MNERIIAPSILSLDYSKMKEQIEELNKSNAQWFHFDVMDAHFVDNLTFGPIILKGYRKLTNKVLDVHLMVTDPKKYAKIFLEAGADCISFHSEAVDNDLNKMEEIVDMIQEKGKLAGIVVKPKTAIEIIEPLLKKVDYVLIMSVEPGFGGQSFMEDQLDKVRWLVQKREELHLNYRIEIDGGINDKTYQLAADAGVDTFVAGSYVFKGDIATQVDSLLK